MARLKGGLIESNFDLSKRAPLDARELVTKYEDLINPSVWQISGTTFETLYNGLTVSVSEVGPNMGKYFLLDRKAVTPENYNAYLQAKSQGEELSKFFSMWEKLVTNKELNEKVSNIPTYELPTATAIRLGGVKLDNKTIKINEDQQIYVAEFSTDFLIQGEKTLVLNNN